MTRVITGGKICHYVKPFQYRAHHKHNTQTDGRTDRQTDGHHKCHSKQCFVQHCALIYAAPTVLTSKSKVYIGSLYAVTE